MLYATDVATLQGNWSRVSDSSAAGGQRLSSADHGWSTVNAALASPSNYVEATFSANSGTSYHLWLRMRATSNTKWNESVWVQFSDAVDQNGSAVYRIGTTSALLVNLENCNGCGVSGWGWQDGAYWLSQPAVVRFPSTGSRKIRIQTREDGVQIDQIVLSPTTYLSNQPGPLTNDSTIVSKSSTTTTTAATSSSGGPSPYGGTPAAIPGTVEAERFDDGGEGVAYHDTGSGNAGGAFRSTGVDIEGSSEGGYNVGWTASGEWMNYTVNVASSGTYTVKLRVASPGGATMHVGFNGSSPVWKALSIPSTGGWQNWTTVSFTATIAAGRQLLTIYFDNGGVNLNRVEVASGSTSTGGSTSSPPPATSTGSQISVLTWNINISDWSEGHARRAMERAVAVSPRPQVIAIQEAYRSRFDIYIDELQRRTGVKWYGAFQVTCPVGGWNGSSCTKSDDGGIGIFSVFPIQSSDYIWLPYADCWTSARVALRAALNVNGKIVQVFNTHLQTGSCSNVIQQRYQSMTKIEEWARRYATPQIVAGDFNADPDQIASTSGMAPDFVESFAVAGTGSRFTYPASNPTMKLDYWFFDKNWGAQPVSSEVVTSTGSASDHRPVRATFLIR